ncbi:MAG: glucose-6-phosphate isomerase [Steroidobacteraceae bacterium]
MGAVTQTAAWHELERLARERGGMSVAEAFANDPARGAALAVEAEGLLLDLSRQRIDADVLTALCRLADERDLRGAIDAMFRGDVINVTEQRQVLHVALRGARAAANEAAANPWGAAIAQAVLDERARMLAFAEAVRSGGVRGSAGRAFTQVVNIGIGGSDLGPCMAVQALRAHADGPRVSFVSNVDGCDLADVLGGCDPATTLFVICSKTFTTQETLANARSARAWLAAALGEAAVREHFAAVSVNAAAMDAFGVHPDYRFVMWDWVGGRYSMWSSIGVAVAIAIGAKRFGELLAGAAAMDAHFRSAPWAQNLPVLMGLVGIWNIKFLKLPTLAVLPYDARLARSRPFCSSSTWRATASASTRAAKRRVRDRPRGLGRARQQRAAFVLPAAAPGHGARRTRLPGRGGVVLRPARPPAARDRQLPRAGRGVHARPAGRLRSAYTRAIVRSSILAFRRLDPFTLGQLVALYEHKVYVQSVIWGINAFDQYGVELGKKLCEGCCRC